MAKVAHENIVSMLTVWDKPGSIRMELCKFTFIPFGGTEVVDSLDKILVLMCEERYFPGIEKVISGDITNAIAYVHGQLLICMERILYTEI